MAAVGRPGRQALHHEECRHARYPEQRRGRDVFQIVFCDQGTPGVLTVRRPYGRLRIALVERGACPPNGCDGCTRPGPRPQRTALFADCRAGRVAVLIGSTDTLGTGSNVQTRLRAIHHLDAPWRPSDVEQREGRALRPGNLNTRGRDRPLRDPRHPSTATCGRHSSARHVSSRTCAAVTPADRIVDDIGDTVLSYAEVKALATGNELLLEHARAAAEVARLRVLQSVSRQTLTVARAPAFQPPSRTVIASCQRERMLRSAARAPVAKGVGNDRRRPVRRPRTLRARMRHPDDAGVHRAPSRAVARSRCIELLPRRRMARAPDPARSILRVTLAHRVVDEMRAVGCRSVRRDPATVDAVLSGLAQPVTRTDRRVPRMRPPNPTRPPLAPRRSSPGTGSTSWTPCAQPRRA